MPTLIDKTDSLVNSAKQGVFTYSEIFHSIQGEGAMTGRNTLWIRFFGCNLQCSGFGQINPKDSSTWVLPYKDYDATRVNRVEDLPVFEHGCDTPYSWSAKFKHLMHHKTAAEIYVLFEQKLRNEHNPLPQFRYGGNEIDLCFTGGEPLLPHTQKAIIAIVQECIDNGNIPARLSIETNGTQELLPEFIEAIKYWREDCDLPFFFSVSPKLWSVAGETPEKAFKPEIISSYAWESEGQLKFVANGTEECWGEIGYNLGLLRGKNHNVDWPVYIMKVGSVLEGKAGELPGHYQTESEFVQEVLRRGFHYSGRIHIDIFGNVVGS